jgi:DNA-binding transcriptional MocR family regulator
MAAYKWLPKMAAIWASEKPVYIANADSLAAAITAGELALGRRLPAQRELASLLSVDLTTVTRAYREAHSCGLVEAHAGRGTFVADVSAASRINSGLVDMAMNHPRRTPTLRTSLRSALEEMSQIVDTDVPTGYGAHAGNPTDRLLGAQWVAQRLHGCQMEQLAICSGVQGALLLFCLTAVGGGGKLLTQSLTYAGIKSVAAHLDIELIGVPLDEHGLCPDALRRRCAQTGARALYCTPALHNPTAVTMPLERRREIAQVIDQTGLLVLEDDVYGLLRAHAPAALATLVPAQVLYATSLSKIAAPALRVGYLVTPSARWFTQLEGAMRAVVFSSSPYNVLVARALIAGGYLSDVVASITTEARVRQQIAAEYMADANYHSAVDSHHGCLTLPPQRSTAAYVALAVGGLSL